LSKLVRSHIKIDVDNFLGAGIFVFIPERINGMLQTILCATLCLSASVVNSFFTREAQNHRVKYPFATFPDFVMASNKIFFAPFSPGKFPIAIG